MVISRPSIPIRLTRTFFGGFIAVTAATPLVVLLLSMWILAKPAASAAVTVTVAATGIQTATMAIPSTGQYIGGAFRISAQGGSTTVTRFAIRQAGTVSGANLDGVHLHYDYDCAQYAESDPLYGVATTLSSGKAVYTGSLVVSPTQSPCLYTVLDVKNTALSGQTIDIEIASPRSEMIASGDVEICPTTPENTCPTANLKITGVTTALLPPPSVVTVGALGTQTATMTIPSTSEYIGGAFSMIPDSGSASLTSITLTKTGTVSDANLSEVKLLYDFDTIHPYDCASESFHANDTPFGAVSRFSSGKVLFTDTITLTTTQAACFYVVLDVFSAAIDGQTLEIKINNPSADIVAVEGTMVSPTNAVAIAGTTILRAPPQLVVTASPMGTQIPLVYVPSASQYLGGTFRLIPNISATFITRIAVTRTGTVSNSHLAKLHLHYDLDTTEPYNCESESFSEGDPVYGLPFADFPGKAIFTGSIEIKPTQVLCLYPIFDVLRGASDGQTVGVALATPSSEIIASGGATVSPSSAVTITGTTVLSLAPPATRPAGINDGDLIRAVGDHRVYIVKFGERKNFIRHIIDPSVFTFYGHMNFSVVKEVPSLEGYTLSAWVRLPAVRGDTESEKVYEINDDPGPGGSRHWITCATPTICESTWRAHGGDPDGVYTINRSEMDYYVYGSHVFLQ